ncbi:hypothetical protein Tco_0418988 [Tanacetum coccineum]
MGVSRDLRGDSRGYVPRSLFWRETLIEMENMGLTFSQVSSKAHREGVGLRVANSYTGNHPEGGFTPFETIRRLLVVIGRRSYSGFEGETFEPKRRDTIAMQRCGLSAKELNKFLSSYPIPSEYDILPTSIQTIFDAPPEMAFRNFIYTEDDDDLAFLPKEPSPGFEVTAESGESPKAGVFVVHPGSVAARIKERKCKTRGGSARPPVVPYAAMELVHSDELGRLMGKLVSSAITYGRCRAYEQVVAMKEPFDLSKVKGYHSSYQKEHTQASNDFATAMFPWLDEFIADAAAPIEALLSKKPPIL